jgi:hypothetical protein
MRGKPWIRFSLMAAVLAMFAIPIWMLTRADAPSPAPVPASEPRTTQREVTLEIETAPAAQAVGASYLGRELIAPGHSGGNFSGTIQLPSNSAADLIVTARWSGTATAALRVRASDESGLLTEASFWGAEEVRDVVTVPEAQR